MTQIPNYSTERNLTIGDATPWGAAETIEQLAPGIAFVSTPSHGGFYLSPSRNACVPYAWRKASFNQQALSGWYEEDCDACMVALWFTAEIGCNNRAAAQRCFDHWIAPKLKRAA